MYQKSPKLTSQLAQEIFQLHKDWLMYSWSSYSPEAHKGLGLMYVGDERFTSYYEQHGAGFAEALNAIIQNYNRSAPSVSSTDSALSVSSNN